MPTWVRACATDDIEPEDVVPFEHAGEQYAIYRSERDEYYASEGYCTHEQALLCDGLVLDGVIECPRHNGRFDFRTGRTLGAPALVDLKTYPVRIDDDVVFVDVDA